MQEQIHRQLDIYRELFQLNCKFDWTKVRQTAKEFHASVGRLAPNLLEEMRGIADGVKSDKVDILDIIALNARSEIALGQWDDGCTSLAWTLDQGSNQPAKQILAQNWDWRSSVGENLAMVAIHQPGKPDIWMVTEVSDSPSPMIAPSPSDVPFPFNQPGIIGKIGFNSESVGVCLNAIRARPISTSLLPIHLILRIALECSSVDSAIARIEELGGAASSQHILIADSNGSRGLELSPRGGSYLKPNENGILVHTNHFLENKLVEEPPWLSGSPFRLERARELCRELLDKEGPDVLNQSTPAILRNKLFSDSENAPQAICCVPDPERGPLASIETLFNIVMTFIAGGPPSAEVVFGRPGTSNQVYSLPW